MLTLYFSFFANNILYHDKLIVWRDFQNDTKIIDLIYPQPRKICQRRRFVHVIISVASQLFNIFLLIIEYKI